jgi:hypothetical protein
VYAQHPPPDGRRTNLKVMSTAMMDCTGWPSLLAGRYFHRRLGHR